jgi:PAS domain S-box-containing protein
MKERKKKRPKVRGEAVLLDDVLNGLQDIDGHILHGVSLKEALEKICRSVVHIFDLRFCWIGLVGTDTGEIRPTAYWGTEEGDLSFLQGAYDDGKYEKGPSRTAIRTRKPQIVKDIEKDPSCRPWRDEALKRGYRSSVAFPLICEGKVVGVLNAYSSETGYFGQKRVKMIQAFAAQATILVTAAKRLEALQASEAKYRGLVEAANDAIISVDEEGKILLWNPAAERIFGYVAKDVLGKEFVFLISEEYRERSLRGFQRAKKRGRLKHKSATVIEGEGLRRDGTTFPLEHSVSLEETPQGLQFTAIVRDVSERKRAEMAASLLQEVTSLISLSPDIESALEGILRIVCEFTGWEFGEAWVPSFDETALEIVASWQAGATNLEEFVKSSRGFTVGLQFRRILGFLGASGRRRRRGG